MTAYSTDVKYIARILAACNGNARQYDWAPFELNMPRSTRLAADSW